eukprot:300297_1
MTLENLMTWSSFVVALLFICNDAVNYEEHIMDGNHIWFDDSDVVYHRDVSDADPQTEHTMRTVLYSSGSRAVYDDGSTAWSHPTNKPTHKPTVQPTHAPTNHPTIHPTHNPTKTPTKQPTNHPTTRKPTTHPTMKPTRHPTQNNQPITQRHGNQPHIQQ